MVEVKLIEKLDLINISGNLTVKPVPEYKKYDKLEVRGQWVKCTRKDGSYEYYPSWRVLQIGERPDETSKD